MRNYLPLGCLALALAGPAYGQSPRLKFLDVPSPDHSITGRFTLRVSDDPFTRPQNARIVIKMDGQLLAECNRTPCELAWETEGVEDGRHLLQLVMIEQRGGKSEERILDERTISLKNHRNRVDVPKPAVEEKPKVAEPKHPAPEPPKTQPVQKPAPMVDDTKVQKAATVVDDSKQTSQPVKHEETSVEKPAARQEPFLSSRAIESPAPALRNVNATCITSSGSKLYIGLAGGGVTVYDVASRSGKMLAAPLLAGETRAVTGNKDTVCWLTAPTIGSRPASQKSVDVVAARVVGPQLFVYRAADESTATYDLAPIADRLEPKQIFVWGGQVVLMSGSAGVVLNTKSGQFTDLDEALPAEALKARRNGGSLRFFAEGSTAVLASVETSDSSSRGSDVRIWKSRGRDWTGGDPRPVPSVANPALVLTSSSLTLISQDSVTTLSLSSDSEAKSVPMAQGLPNVDSRSQVTASGTESWWLRGGILCHTDSESGASDALFPWNEKGLKPNSIAADRGSVWVATNAGVRRISLGDSNSGYDGFVRARMGEDTMKPEGPAELRLAAAIESWTGTPYLWGGESRKGVDCSGFVMLAFQDCGVSLPHGSDNLRNCSKGERVTDELHYGDVLVYPGHTAIYIGNGQTAETVSSGKGGVGRSSIWRRTEVVVRRFLNTQGEPKALASRGGKPPLRKPTKKRS